MPAPEAAAPNYTVRPRAVRPLTDHDKAHRLVGHIIDRLRRRGAIVGGVSVELRRSLVQNVEARLSWSDQRWRREYRSEGEQDENATE